MKDEHFIRMALTAGDHGDEVEMVVLAASEVTGVPEFIQLVPSGRITPKGVTAFIVDAQSRRMVIEHWLKRKNPAVIDFEHQNLKGTEAPAAGWIEDMEDRGDGPQGGIWGKVKWTPRAAEYLKNREYRFLSPVIFRRKADDRLMYIDHAALTNDPAIDGMVPIVNKTGVGQHGEVPQNEKEDRMLEFLKKLLGLPETATEEMVQAACKALYGFKEAVVTTLALKADAEGKDAETAITALKSAVPDELAEALGCGATLSACKGTVLGLKEAAKDGGLAGQVAALTARQAEKDADDAVKEALKAGKVTPANEGWAMDYAKKDLEGFLAFCKAAPKIVGGPVRTVDGHGGEAMDETAMGVCKQLGITVEKFKAASNKEGGTE